MQPEAFFLYPPHPHNFSLFLTKKVISLLLWLHYFAVVAKLAINYEGKFFVETCLFQRKTLMAFSYPHTFSICFIHFPWYRISNIFSPYSSNIARKREKLSLIIFLFLCMRVYVYKWVEWLWHCEISHELEFKNVAKSKWWRKINFL